VAGQAAIRGGASHNQIVAWMRTILAPDQVVELRALHVQQRYGRPRTVAGFFSAEHVERMVKEALALSGKAKGVYFTLNPLNPDLLARRCSRVDVAETNELAADRDVLRRRWLLVDADPVRLSGISATDIEKAKALQVARSIRLHLCDRGWPEPMKADSGNGYHLLYRIDLPTEHGEIVRRVLRVLASRFSSDAVVIDTAVFNAARICKFPGTLTMKGDPMPDRPHRVAQLLEVV
jgi:hypothetical protein